MKKALMKDMFREINKTKKKFISILIMAFLGVGFFAGIKATSPDMQLSIDKYFDEKNVYDVEVLSTLGLTDEDVKALQEVENIKEVYPTYEIDAQVNILEEELICRIMALDEKINIPNLLLGNMPKSLEECAVESDFLTQNNLQLGDKIIIEINQEEGEKDFIKEKELKIVGIVESPLYVSRDRGTTKLGNGKINYYVYVTKENINYDIYTKIYLTVKNVEELNTCANEYENHIDITVENIKKIKEEAENRRYKEVFDEANEKIKDAEIELAEEKQKGEDEINKNEKELLTAKRKIDSSVEDLKILKEEASEGFEAAQKEIDLKREEFNSIKRNLEVQVANNIALLEQQKDAKQIELNAITDTNSTEYIQISGVIKQIEDQIILINATKENQLKEGETQLNNAQTDLNSKINSTNEEFKTAQIKINTAKTKYENGKKELEEAKGEFNTKISEAEAEIADAKIDLAKIEKAKWYILTRKDNRGYNSFVQDSNSVKNISTVFPIIFFLIAILISLTTMTRMVETDRGQIGTYKILGYSTTQIAIKYIFYAGIASVIGGVFGSILGTKLIPIIIWKMYSMMYIIPEFVLDLNVKYSILGILVISICIIGATVYSIRKEIKEVPAALLRPKAPKAGKRVLLERVKFIWKRLNFIQKVTVRNMFRYKKRFLLTVIGISGCTALILTGFGIKDAVNSLIPNQYEKIFEYDLQIALNDEVSNEKIDTYVDELNKNEKLEEVLQTRMEATTLRNNEKTEETQIIIPNDSKELLKFIKLISIDTKTDIELNNETIVLSDKLADLLGAKKGDTLEVENSGKVIELKVGDITENYISNYVYMTKELYESLYEVYNTNILLINEKGISQSEEDVLVKELLSNEDISSIVTNSYMRNLMDETFESLDYVVLVLIVSSGLLAFVVLYNLANVNISERIRELSTIKVLGFYDNEVYEYVNREMTILTIIGIAFGLLGGWVLSAYIMKTCEINMIRFTNNINFISYLYAIGITLIFTCIVNMFIYKTLRKINMIESLKSVE